MTLGDVRIYTGVTYMPFCVHRTVDLMKPAKVNRSKLIEPHFTFFPWP